jgi:hypothetical protein
MAENSQMARHSEQNHELIHNRNCMHFSCPKGSTAVGADFDRAAA